MNNSNLIFIELQGNGLLINWYTVPTQAPTSENRSRHFNG